MVKCMSGLNEIPEDMPEEYNVPEELNGLAML